MELSHILLLPDSFKGSLSATQVCRVLERAIHTHLPHTRVTSAPVADGGEGTVDCFLTALGGERRTLTVAGPYFTPMPAFYGLLPPTEENGRTVRTAVVEMAACAGLPLVGERRNPLLTTTYGVGELIANAAGQADRIIVGLGGSATNDGGAGAMAALGIRFLRGDGAAFVPTGGTLSEIAAIDPSGLLPGLAGVELVTMCDIDNPLCGPRGASAVFGPQKGADLAMVELLDRGLAHLAQCIRRDVGADILTLPGGGAAGGMGAGLAGFLRSPLRMGTQVVLDTIGFESLAKGADLVITGEGNLDSQSIGGKVAVGVARRAKACGLPTVALVGGVSQGVDREALRREGISAVFPICPRPLPLSEAVAQAEENLAFAAGELLALVAAL